jgi:hypothetical protein
VNGLCEELEVNRFDQVRIEARLSREVLIRQLSVAGDREKYHPTSCLRGAQLPRYFPAVEAWETDVDDGDVRLKTESLGEPRDAVLGLMHLMPVKL